MAGNGPEEQVDALIVTAVKDEYEAEGGILRIAVTQALGMGKTRLFIELCKRLREAGWRAGARESGERRVFVEKLTVALLLQYVNAAP